jgi:hypothetical protein
LFVAFMLFFAIFLLFCYSSSSPSPSSSASYSSLCLYYCLHVQCSS